MVGLQDIDEAWKEFLEDESITDVEQIDLNKINDVPSCGDLYISTKTKIAFLSKGINLAEIFWELPLIGYYEKDEGIIKKEMKFNSINQKELDNIIKELQSPKYKNNYIQENIINRVVNPNGRVKFKDIRKISIGLCKKDIASYKCKKKGAFYNCFVIILRVKFKNTFKEIHVKVFNTGKLEIPGIQENEILTRVLDLTVNILNKASNLGISSVTDSCETVLINSNFNCGFFINRDKLFQILKLKYKINCSYDPCSYPGIQAEYATDSIKKISFMVFRTGSVLIVGKCSEDDLYFIYNFLKTLLINEYNDIFVEYPKESKPTLEKKKRRKTILFYKD